MEQVPFALPGAIATYTAEAALFTAGASDRGTFFDSTGSFTITIDTTGMAAGWSAWFRNVSGTQTLDPSGATLINGASTYAVSNAGDVVLVTYTGSAFVVAHTQRPSTVAITGGTINGAAIGGVTPAAGAFTTLTANGATTLTANTTSSSTTTGTLVVTGGLGVSGATFIGGAFNVAGATILAGSGGTTIGDGTAAVRLTLDGLAATVRRITWGTAGVTRWELRCNNTAESGSDAGSNLVLEARTDSGSVLDQPLTLIRATGGLITVARPVSVTNATASTSTTTGALVVTGGVGISGAVHIGTTLGVGMLTTGGWSMRSGDFTVTNTTTSGQAYIAMGEVVSGATPFYITRYGSTHATKANKVEIFNSNAGILSFGTTNTERVTISASAGDVAIASSTASTSTTTGALVVAGGVGVAGQVTTGTLKVTSTTSSASILCGFNSNTGSGVVLGSNNSMFISDNQDTSSSVSFAWRPLGSTTIAGIRYQCNSTTEVFIDSATFDSSGNASAGKILTLNSSGGVIKLGGALKLANAYVGTPQVGTGYVTLQDSSGTTYKVLVAT